MKVTELQLENFRGFKNLQINLHPDMNIFVGINGSGKSSILESLAILLSRLTGRICSTKGTGRFFTESDIKNKTSQLSAEISVEYKEKSLCWKVIKDKRRVKRQGISQLDAIKELASSIRAELDENPKLSIPIAVFYSVNRAVLDIPLRIRKKHKFDQIASYDQALSNKRNDFRLFFEWFRMTEDIENEKVRDDRDFVDIQLNAVRTAIEKFTGFSDIKVRRYPLRMTVSIHNMIFNVSQLSDGEKNLLALIGDLARRLAIANPAMENPLLGSGVVLIDEIDLHLHPGLQREVVKKLPQLFPNCQFILSTHSPQTISEVTKDKIFLLDQDPETFEIQCKKPTQSLGLDSNEILQELMGAQIRNEDVDLKIKYIFELIDDEDFSKAQDEIDALKKLISGSIPALIEAEATITMLKED